MVIVTFLLSYFDLRYCTFLIKPICALGKLGGIVYFFLKGLGNGAD